MQRLRSSDSGHFSSHSSLSSLRLFALLAFWRIFLSPQSLVQTLGNSPASELHDLPPCPHPTKGAGNSKKESTTSRALTKTKSQQLKRKIKHLHQSTAISTWCCGPRPRLGWAEMVVGLPEGPSYPSTTLQFFAMLLPERPRTAFSKLVACFF